VDGPGRCPTLYNNAMIERGDYDSDRDDNNYNVDGGDATTNTVMVPKIT